MSLPPRVVGLGSRSFHFVGDPASAIAGLVAATNDATGGALTQAAGDAANYAASSVPSADLSALQQVYSQLSIDAQAAVQTGTKVIQATQPIRDYISWATSKQASTATPVEVTAKTFGAFAATVAVVNPVVGAGVAAFGVVATGTIALAQEIFGIAHETNAPTGPSYDYIGFHRVGYDPLPVHAPAPDGTVNPNWIYFTSYLDYLNWATGQKYTAPNGTVWEGFAPKTDWSAGVTPGSINRGALRVLYQNCLMRSIKDWEKNYFIRQNDQGVFVPMSASEVLTASKEGSTGWTSPSGPFGIPAALIIANRPSDFEVYVNNVMLKNLEFWANGLPFIPIRSLLAACVKIWNSNHSTKAVVSNADDDFRFVFPQLQQVVPFQGHDNIYSFPQAVPVEDDRGGSFVTSGFKQVGISDYKRTAIDCDPGMTRVIYNPATSQGSNEGYNSGDILFLSNGCHNAESLNLLDSTYTGGFFFGGSTVSAILGPWGGWLDPTTPIASTEDAVYLNPGPPVDGITKTGLPAVATTPTTVTPAIAAAVSVPVGAALGTIVYSYATGQAVDTVLKSAWKGVKRLFR